MPAISVLMSVYNPDESQLKEAIESILNQTFKDFEFIIYDNGSATSTEAVVMSYNDSRIKFIQGEKGHSLGYALNTLMNLASGKYAARMDADDISYPTRLQEQYEFMESHPEISILGTNIKTFPKKKLIKYKERPGYFDVLKSCCIAHPTVMMRSADLRHYNINYDKNVAAEDYELWSRAIMYLKFTNLQKVLLDYRVHKNSTTRKCNVEIMEQHYLIRKQLLKFLTSDTKLQKKIMNLAKQESVIKKIFQVKNGLYQDGCYKIIVLFGFNIKLYKKFSYEITPR